MAPRTKPPCCRFTRFFNPLCLPTGTRTIEPRPDCRSMRCLISSRLTSLCRKGLCLWTSLMRTSRPAWVKNMALKILPCVIGNGDPTIVNVKRKNEVEHEGLTFINGEVISHHFGWWRPACRDGTRVSTHVLLCRTRRRLCYKLCHRKKNSSPPPLGQQQKSLLCFCFTDFRRLTIV